MTSTHQLHYCKYSFLGIHLLLIAPSGEMMTAVVPAAEGTEGDKGVDQGFIGTITTFIVEKTPMLSGIAIL